MARNKIGLQKATEQKKTDAVIETVTNGIVETTTNPDPKKHVQRTAKRVAAAIRREARKRHKMNISGKTSIEAPQDKIYDVLCQYHQLNYTAIKAELEENNFKPTVIDNTRFWIIGINGVDLEKLKEAMRKCHFTTKQKKEYKVRLAAYKHIDKTPKEKKEKHPTNNKPEVASTAKKARKARIAESFKKRIGHKSRRASANKLRSQKNVNHKPGVLNTCSIVKKLQERTKKAIKANECAERDRATQAKSRANKGIPKPKNGKQLEIAA